MHCAPLAQTVSVNPLARPRTLAWNDQGNHAAVIDIVDVTSFLPTNPTNLCTHLLYQMQFTFMK